MDLKSILKFLPKEQLKQLIREKLPHGLESLFGFVQRHYADQPVKVDHIQIRKAVDGRVYLQVIDTDGDIVDTHTSDHLANLLCEIDLNNLS